MQLLCLKIFALYIEELQTHNPLNGFYHLLLRQHRTENCVQKMSLRGKIKT